MANVLYITANPKAVEYSASLQVGQTFIEAYKEVNPNDEITTLDLVTLEYSDIDYTVMGAVGKLMNGVDFSDLTAEEQSILGVRQGLLKQFMAADKVIFVTPMWELGYPSYVKKYLDVITVAGETFRYTEKGLPEGLLRGMNKKAMHIQASGGNYTDEIVKLGQSGQLGASMMLADNYSDKQLHAMMHFIGIEDYTHIYASQQSTPEAATELEAAKQKAIELAKTW